MGKNNRQKICDVRVRIALPTWLYNEYRILTDSGAGDGRSLSEVIRAVMRMYRVEHEDKFKQAKELMRLKYGGVNIRKIFGDESYGNASDKANDR